MSKKKEIPQIKAEIIEQNLTDTLESNYMPYAMSVIVSRAIPEIDGFKPVHRKILYTMYNMGLLRGDRRKSADVVGQTMKLHPHGDMAIYETLVRLSRGNGALLHPFVDSKGNFGKQYSRDMAFAAPRYTECKLDGVCDEIFGDIAKDAVNMTDNYDGTMKEPSLLPVTFPNILVSANLGIAVGMASSICGFNLREICDAAIALIKNPAADLMKIISGPDFAAGAEYLRDEDELKSVLETGRGSLKLRAKYRYDKKASCIEVYEIPYTTSIEAVTDKIVQLVKAGKLREVTDVRDETGIDGLKIAIDIRRASDADAVAQKLFRLTPLQDAFSCNFNVLIDGKPYTLGVRQITLEWLKFRENCVRRALMFEMGKNREKLHMLLGLTKIILDIDKAIAIIRQTADDAQVVPNLCAGFDIDASQAEFVAEIKLRNLNKDYLLNKVKETESLKKEIAETEEILADSRKIYDIIITELKRVAKKYGADRKTDVISGFEETPDAPDAFVDDYNVRLFLTEHSYFKKITAQSLRASNEQYLKDEDKIIVETDAPNKSEILFFSDRFNVYKAKTYEMAEYKASSLGDFLPNVLGAESGEKIVFFAVLTEYAGFFVFAFQNGKIAKVTAESYATVTNRKKLLNAYSDKSPVVKMEYIKEDADFLALRDYDKAVLLNTSLISPVSAKNSQGVQAVTLRKNGAMTGLLRAEAIGLSDPEHFRTDKIPSAGHFLTDSDKDAAGVSRQLTL